MPSTLSSRCLPIALSVLSCLTGLSQSAIAQAPGRAGADAGVRARGDDGFAEFQERVFVQEVP